MREPRRLTILGSTGSIGQSTLNLVQRNRNIYSLVALTAGTRVKALAEQARLLRPEVAVIADARLYGELKEALAGTGVEAAAGDAAVCEAARRPSDWCMAAIVGADGLRPTLAAVEQGKVVAFANKETLVCAGEIVMRRVAESGATLLPVDSEHNAIFQVFDSERPGDIERIILTASGGPFRELSLSEMADKTSEQAVAHPNWSMGAKISVDSATMMNKGLELIEAGHLFDFPSKAIEILVHPQSIIHSMVAYQDGSVLAQLGSPDMRTPIAHALAWPHRMEAPVARLNLVEIAKLTFENPDSKRFPALSLARTAMEKGGILPLALNAANEVAVAAFLRREIGFLDIAAVVEETMERMPEVAADSLGEILIADKEARRLAQAASEGHRLAAQ
ncbi:MAG: 1-deoxy-D-xylulose-5-phosphate reductoisomerase [Rhodospirillales bacterium]|nr:1-deoxy-D-xylulose-5-phosphate reductoisomerase [Rhodospirillales bacterium]